MCVAGCPQPLDGPTGAVHMAAMALDMVDAVERFESSNGHRIQIRVGIHSGGLGSMGLMASQRCTAAPRRGEA